jgi:serralysin
VLRGAGGADQFVFNMTGSNNTDTLADFSHAQHDKIVFDNLNAFSALPDGSLASGRFHAAGDIGASGGGTGVGANDRVLYDTDTGRLYYDSNGSAAGQRVLLGIVSDSNGDHPTLVAGDFRVI